MSMRDGEKAEINSSCSRKARDAWAEEDEVRREGAEKGLDKYARDSRAAGAKYAVAEACVARAQGMAVAMNEHEKRGEKE